MLSVQKFNFQKPFAQQGKERRVHERQLGEGVEEKCAVAGLNVGTRAHANREGDRPQHGHVTHPRLALAVGEGGEHLGRDEPGSPTLHEGS